MPRAAALHASSPDGFSVNVNMDKRQVRTLWNDHKECQRRSNPSHPLKRNSARRGTTWPRSMPPTTHHTTLHSFNPTRLMYYVLCLNRYPNIQKMCRLLLMHVARFETPLVFLAAKRKQAANIPNKIPAQVRLDTYIFLHHIGNQLAIQKTF